MKIRYFFAALLSALSATGSTTVTAKTGNFAFDAERNDFPRPDGRTGAFHVSQSAEDQILRMAAAEKPAKPSKAVGPSFQRQRWEQAGGGPNDWREGTWVQNVPPPAGNRPTGSARDAIRSNRPAAN
jgi:hypothetical protein